MVWCGFLLYFLVLIIGAVADKISPDCVAADATMHYLNETGTYYQLQFYCIDMNGNFKCSNLYMNRCIANDNGYLRIKKEEDEKNPSLKPLDQSCECELKACGGEFWCNCATNTKDDSIRTRSAWRWRRDHDPGQ